MGQEWGHERQPSQPPSRRPAHRLRPGRRPPGHRHPRLHRVHRHPGHRPGAAQPRPLPRDRAVRRRRPGRAARRAGARGCGCAPSPSRDEDAVPAAARGARPRSTARASRCRRSSPGRGRPPSSPPPDCHTVLNGITGSIGLAPDPRRPGGRPDARPRQQGVADRRRPAGQGGWPSPARSSRSTPSTPRSSRRCCRHPRRGAQAGRHRLRRALPRPHAEPSWPASPPRTRWHTPPGPWAR